MGRAPAAATRRPGIERQEEHLPPVELCAAHFRVLPSVPEVLLSKRGIGLEPSSSEDDRLCVCLDGWPSVGSDSYAGDAAATAVPDEPYHFVAVSDVDAKARRDSHMVCDHSDSAADVSDVHTAPEQVAPVGLHVRLSRIHELEFEPQPM